MASLCLYWTIYMLVHASECVTVRICAPRVYVCVGVCNSFLAQLSWVTEFCAGGPCAPLWHQGCHCAPVTINHVVRRLALFRREGTNHTPHYPGLVTLKQCSPRDTSACCCLDGERKKSKCAWRRWTRERGNLFILPKDGYGLLVNE